MKTEWEYLEICAALIGGEAFGFAAEKYGSLYPLCALATLLVALVGYGLEIKRWPFVAVFFAGFTLALAVSDRRHSVLDTAHEVLAGRPFTAVFTLPERFKVVHGDDYLNWVSFKSDISGLPVRVYFAYNHRGESPKSGERWRLTGWLQRGSDSAFDETRSFWVKGGRTSAEKIGSAGGGLLFRLLGRVRSSLSWRLAIGLKKGSVELALARAIFLGDRGALDVATKKSFVAAGTVHVFAISGMHVFIVARVLLGVICLTGFSVRFAPVAVLPFIWLYVAAIGLPASAVRAALMISIHSLAPVFWRRGNAVVSWSVALVIVYTVSPSKFFDVGSTLSFTVMLSLILCGRSIEKIKKKWVSMLVLTSVAWAAGVPIAAHVFGRITPGGLFANATVPWFAGCSVSFGALGVVTSFFSETLAAYLNNYSALSTSILADVSRVVAEVPGANWEIEKWSTGTAVAWYVGYALVFAAVYRFVNRPRGVL